MRVLLIDYILVVMEQCLLVDRNCVAVSYRGFAALSALKMRILRSCEQGR